MNYQRDIIDSDIAQKQAIARTFTGRVMTYMAAAVALSGVIAYLFGTDASLLSYLVNFETGSLKPLAWISIFAPFGLVLLMSAGINKMSAGTMLLVFIAFSALIINCFILFVFTFFFSRIFNPVKFTKYCICFEYLFNTQSSCTTNDKCSQLAAFI